MDACKRLEAACTALARKRMEAAYTALAGEGGLRTCKTAACVNSAKCNSTAPIPACKIKTVPGYYVLKPKMFLPNPNVFPPDPDVFAP